MGNNDQCWSCDNADIDKNGVHCMILWPVPNKTDNSCKSYKERYNYKGGIMDDNKTRRNNYISESR